MKLITLMENTSARDDLYSEHGLSLYIETGDCRILFDAGQTELFSENAEKLNVDLKKVDLAILSHGHYDHSGGLMRFLQLNDHAPLYMNERAFSDCWHGADHYIGIDQSLRDSGRIILTGDEYAVAPQLTLYTMNALPRRFPLSGAGLTVRQPDGSFLQDEFLHEHYLLIEENGKRILISGCSHKGILNIMEWLKPDVLIGGFHFMKMDPMQDRSALKDAADALNAYETVYYTCHCTGTEQYAALKEWMGDKLRYISAGDCLII
ncbi:MAG: MBL fold metallo-hydrolase [Clostridia bacterium]|nr:MBL fold metallo-hydrolase [Clostridia bacterium]